MLNYKIKYVILLIIILLILIVLISTTMIENYSNNYLYKIKSNYCANKNLDDSYMPQKCCYFNKKKKEFMCEDKNCRCKSKETGICEICY